MTNVQPVKSLTLGQHLDAVLTAAGHDVTIGATAAESFSAKAWAWLSAEWHNVITAISTGAMALKMFGKL